MEISDLLRLEQNAHLSFAKLESADPELARKLKPQIDARLTTGVVETFAAGSPTLRRAARLIDKVPTPKRGERLHDLAVRALRAAVAADTALANDPELKKEIESIDLSSGPTLTGAAGIDIPLRDHPALAGEIARARVHRFAQATRLPAETAIALADIGGLEKIHDSSLRASVASGTLSAAEASRAGRAIAIYAMFDERPELVETLGDHVNDPTQLLALGEAKLRRAIERSKSPTPGGIAPAQYAALLSAKIENAFPTAALAGRFQASNAKAALDPAGDLEELRQLNDATGVLTRDFTALASDGVPAARLEQLRAVHAKTRAAVRRYAGLQLEKVLDDRTLPLERRNAEAARRIDQAHRLFTDNPDLLGLDLRARGTGRDRVIFPADASEEDKRRLLAMVRSYQRVMAVAGEVPIAEKLVVNGMSSASTIATIPVEALAVTTGVTASKASELRARAQDLSLKATTRVSTLLDAIRGGFSDLSVGNVSEEVADFLKEIPGYAEFFGSQDYCDCKHCKSIFGPAAYFVDLMRFIEENVTSRYFSANPGHRLALRIRRPDLWERLELTCENTNQEIPYLEVINETLEDAIARDVGYPGNLSNRVAVRDRVYNGELRQRVHSFQQPFHLPFAELTQYLRHFGRTLADLAEASRASGATLARLRLGLPPLDFRLITTPELNVATLASIYGDPLAGAPNIQPIDVQVLLPRMGVTREQLGALAATQWVSASGAQVLQIRSERRDANSVQNDIERISGLTPAGLDRMHRFVRLWRASGYEIGELDLARSHLERAGVGAALDTTLVGAIAHMHRICNTLQLSVEDAIAMFSTLPERPVLSAPPAPTQGSTDVTIFPLPPSPQQRFTVSLLDRLFNQPRQVELGGRYPKPATRVTHPALALAPPANVDANLQRLHAGLGTNEDQLYQLIVGLARPLGVVPDSTSAADRGMLLTARNLALLYRHARLARLLKVSIPDLFAIAALTLTHGFIDTLDDLDAVIRTQRWIAGSRLTIDALVDLIRPGTPAIAATRNAVTNTAAGASITYTAADHGTTHPAETVVFAANADLPAVIADWNAKAQRTIAYRADARGLPSVTGDRFAIRTRGRSATSRIEITVDATGLFAGVLPRLEVGVDFVLVGSGPATEAPADLAAQLVDEVATAGSLVFTDTVFTGVATLTDAQSRAVVAANAARLEAVDAEGRYRLSANYDPAQPLALAGLPAAVEPALSDVLAAFHARAILLGALPGKLGIAREAVERFVDMLGDSLGDAGTFSELRDPAVQPTRIASLIARLRRLANLFAEVRIFDPNTLQSIHTDRALFGIADFNRLDLAAVRNVELYRTLSESWLDRGEERPDLPGMLVRYTQAAGFSAADLSGLAELLRCDLALVRSLQQDLPSVASPFGAIENLLLAVVVSRHLGVGGDVLGLVRSEDFARLAQASAAIQSALRAKHPDDARWQKVRELFRDAVLSRQRDGLVAYLLSSRRTYPFDEVNDLYHYFLMDPQLEGVTRTSRVAAAISSLQQYVQRCIMNLEETPPGDPNPLRIPPNAIPATQWDWRENYRVWEANRKVFLYPENYLEPQLRDDKTPLFKALEEELLSKPITEEAVREAYARYLRGFEEISSLAIAGSYHERDEQARHDVLHLFGATSDDPPIFYYRRVEDMHFGIGSEDRATRWGSWQRLELQIPTRVVSPIVHKGQLYLFWVRYVTKSLNHFIEGTSRFVGYNHRAYIEFSKRRLDGTWTSPQPITLTEAPFTTRGDGVVLDPLVARTSDNIQLPLLGEIRLYSNYQPLYDSVRHDQPMDDYTLRGFGWDRVYPVSGQTLTLRGINFQMWSNLELFRRRIEPRLNYDPVDPPGSALSDRGVAWIAPEQIEALLFIIWIAMIFGEGLDAATQMLSEILDGRPKNMLWSERTDEARIVHAITLGARQYVTFDAYTFTSLLLERERINYYKQPLTAPGFGRPEWQLPQWHPDVTNYLESLLVPNELIRVPSTASLESVNGTYSDAIIQHQRDAFHIGFRTVDGKPFALRRLSTSVAEPLARTLFNQGLDALLTTSNQMQTNEASHGFGVQSSKVADLTHGNELDFNGPMGTYLREIFFHVPFMLADHLNSLGEFAAAQRWYHVVFDPTSSEVISGIPAGLPEAERRRRELDRVWRFREHRGLTFETLRAQLQNAQAVETYKRDPFNPHAIARLRLTAYQKAVVMKYIDNLLDWGDDLFARAFSQSNPEYLRQATLKYVLAQELLGRRPAKLGECGEGGPRRYTDIVDSLVNDSEFLLEVESLVSTGPSISIGGSFVPRWNATAAAYTAQAYGGRGSARDIAENALGRKLTLQDQQNPPEELRVALGKLTAADFIALAPPDPPLSASSYAVTAAQPARDLPDALSDFGLGFVSQISTVFCIPENPTLRAYWDRVEDRLYKLRNSLDPEGVFRKLPLFAPPLDLGLLLRTRASGVGLEDVLTQSAGGLPPYRFTYLIEKAKSYAATVQGFGTALLGAIEKRDAEELAGVRNRHEKNLLKLNGELRRSELAAAEIAIQQVARQQLAAMYRRDYFDTLISSGLSPPERLQVGFRVTSTVLRGTDAILKLAAGIGYLIPELGSPFAMKYGGKQLGDSFDAFAQAISSAASIAELAAEMSGLIAGFERREEGWKHDRTLANHDIQVMERERAAAELRREISAKGLELHMKSEEQHDEILELYRDKFSGFGLYTYMTRVLQQLHRTAFGSALALAQLAERAYKYELPGDDTSYLGGEWEGAQSGLLSGERLMLSLARMERRFLERNERRLEIVQSFSLEQIAPQQLIVLRESGTAEFRIPEFYFDLFYPGDYRRQIRSVRLSIPSVTGPYVNISARLNLLGSRIRSDAQAGPAALVPIPLGRSSSVATSSAQNDSGTFELNFRDERFNPFEGAGAISDWRIELPSLFRAFDYRTISDVILTINYTAEHNGALRLAVEDAAGADGLAAFLAANPRARAFSLRREFSAAFERLLASPPNTPVTFEVGTHHLPFYLSTRMINVVRSDVVLVTTSAAGAFGLTINGAPTVPFAPPTLPAPFGELPAVRLDAAMAGGLARTHTITVTNPGGLATVTAPARLDPNKLHDIILVAEYVA